MRLLSVCSSCLISIVMITGCARRAVETTASLPIPQPASATSTPASTDAETGADLSDSSVDGLTPAFFAYDSHVLDESAREALDRNARLLRQRPELAITIEGHCDERGTIEYNQALGEQRARAARDYLAAAGISASRIQVLSYGKERPFATDSNETGWAQNRRAHFVGR